MKSLNRTASSILAAAAALMTLFGASTASAGIPECGGVYVAPTAACEVLYSADCLGGCDVAGVVDVCSSSLAVECQASCSVSASVSCTNDCGSTCEQRCMVEDLVCENGCIDECVDTCPQECGDAADPQKCLASCESTCDVECGTKCAELPVDAKCLEHCNQCCFGSCSAQINFDCQLGCQAEGFDTCADAFTTQCISACEGAGSVFCDGQFLVGGDEVTACADALEAQGNTVAYGAKAEVSTDDLISGCNVTGPSDDASWMVILGMAGAGIAFGRRRRRREGQAAE